jgi:hypothetical protein
VKQKIFREDIVSWELLGESLLMLTETLRSTDGWVDLDSHSLVSMSVFICDYSTSLQLHRN